MKKLSRIAFYSIFIISTLIFSVLASDITTFREEQDTLDKLAVTVVFLRNEVIDRLMHEGKEYEIWLKSLGSDHYIPKTHLVSGTGFFIAKSESELFLVTAAHVASTMDEDATVTLRADLNKSITLSIAQLAEQPGSPSWIEHPNADVACIRLSSTQKRSVLQWHFLPISSLASTELAPSRDIQLVILGFPLGLGVVDKFSPISQYSSVASGLLELRPSKSEPASTYFLLQNPSVGGFSGAPVFDLGIASSSAGSIRIRSRRVDVVGLVKGTISDNTGGKFAAIVPAKFILETINLSQ